MHLLLCFLSFLFVTCKVICTENTCLFVSLGSMCPTAYLMRACQVRTASFPFDWICSMDPEMFLRLLEEDFSHFLDTDCLVRDDEYTENTYNAPVHGTVLLNTYYHLEFLHEGNWKADFQSVWRDFTQRYEKRISRFRHLGDFSGKVFFIRSSYPHTDPHRFFRYLENNEISEEYSFRLYDTLRRYFPNLDFTLIVINNHENENMFVTEKKLSDDLILLTIPLHTSPERDKICSDYFHDLMGDASLLPYEQIPR